MSRAEEPSSDDRWWALIDRCRRGAGDPEEVAERLIAALAELEVDDIVAFDRFFLERVRAAYRSDLWEIAYLMNGGCSDDGFDYFRGWLLTQGQEVYDAVLASPDSLASLPVVIAAAESEVELECEEALSIAWNAHLKATGMQLPQDAFRIRYPELAPEWEFDFDDGEELATRLPKLAALYEV